MNKYKIFIGLLILNFLFTTVVFAADPYYVKQWYLKNIEAEKAWEITTGSPQVIVAVIDTGVDIQQPDLKNNIWVNLDETGNYNIDDDKNGFVDDRYGYNFLVGGDGVPDISGDFDRDAVSHGTFVAGLISAKHDNGIGIKGVTTNVKIMPLVALDPKGEGNSSNVAQAIDYAVKNGADIINLSFGGSQYSSGLKNSIINAYNKGVLVVAAAGNAVDGIQGEDLTNNPIYPVCYDQEFTDNKILGVLSTDRENKVSNFSDYGRNCIDIGAPGESMTSLGYFVEDSRYFNTKIKDYWRGSSFAAALVSGTAALMKTVNRNLTPAQMIEIIRDESSLLVLDPFYRDKAGAGVLNVYRAVKKAKELLISNPNVADTNQNTTAPLVNPGNDSFNSINPAKAKDIFVSARANKDGILRVYDYDFNLVNEIEVFGGTNFKGLNFELADVNIGGDPEIIIGAVKGDQPFVRVLDLDGNLLSSFLGFDTNFRGGINVSAGDVNGDGLGEIIVVPQSNYNPVVRIFSLNGQLLGEFLAYNESYKNGLNVDVGDFNKDGKAEIVTAPHAGLLPKIKIFNNIGQEQRSFLAYAAKFSGGVNIDIADIYNDGKLDIITGAGPTGGPHVQAFDYDGNRTISFMAYNTNFTGGVEVSGVDWNGDGRTDIITGPMSNGGPHVKIFSGIDSAYKEFFAFEASFTSGINIDSK